MGAQNGQIRQLEETMNRLPANLVRILVLLLLALRPALAEMCESTGEYEYTHGDNESIIHQWNSWRN